MPHVSPKPVDGDVSRKIEKMLFSAFSSTAVTKKQQELLLRELLTPTEKVMLGKRLAALSLLLEEASVYQVGRSLRLSPTTVTKISERLERGGYEQSKRLLSTLRKGPFQRYLENLLAPLPRYGTSPASLFKKKLDQA